MRIHFGSPEKLPKSIFSHIPDGTLTCPEITFFKGGTVTFSLSRNYTIRVPFPLSGTKSILILLFSARASLASVPSVTFFGEVSISDIFDAFIPARAASCVWFRFCSSRSLAIWMPTSRCASSLSTSLLISGSRICRLK